MKIPEGTNNLNRIISILRQQIADKPSLQKKSSPTRGSRTSNVKRRGGLAPLRRKIVQRLNAMRGEESLRMAVPVFVESVLLWEFGDDAADDPAFADWVGKLSDTLRNDQGLADKMQGLLRLLSGGKD